MKNSKLWFLGVALTLSMNWTAWADCGGGQDGDGVDILPHYQLDEFGQKTCVTDGEWGWIFTDDAPLPGFDLESADGDVKVRVEFGDTIIEPGTGTALRPIHVSGVAYGEAVSEGGFAVPDQSGRLCLIDSETWNSSDTPPCHFRFWNERTLADTNLRKVKIDPEKLTNPDREKEVAGTATNSRGGIPRDRDVLKY